MNDVHAVAVLDGRLLPQPPAAGTRRRRRRQPEDGAAPPSPEPAAAAAVIVAVGVPVVQGGDTITGSPPGIHEGCLV